MILLGSLVQVKGFGFARADVVLEASRPRALAQFGIDAEALTTGTPDGRGPQAWVSITGYGRTGDEANRVAFGDDAAAAGGLVSWTDGEPLFCADAVADPLPRQVEFTASGRSRKS